MSTAREVWEALEPIHAVVYMTPEARDAIAATGVSGFWPGYFSSRVAAMGAVGPEVVEATFHGFSPEMVRRAIPAAWDQTTPEALLAARQHGAVISLERMLGPVAEGPEVATVARLGHAAASSAPLAGRPLFAAHQSLPWPSDPLAAAWHATTLLREHRGDGHVAALTAAGIHGCASQVLAAARGVTIAALQQKSRQWSDAAWDEATSALVARGWIDDAGALTDAGRDAVDAIERQTDAMAETALLILTEPERDDLVAAGRVLARAVWAAGDMPSPNPIGLLRPSWAAASAEGA